MGRPPAGAGRGHDLSGVEGVGRTMSGLVLRVVLVLSVWLAVAVQGLGRDTPTGALVVLGLGLLAAVLPGTPAPGAALLGVIVLTAWHGGGLDVRDAVTVASVHLLHVAAGVAAEIPVRARVEVVALLPSARRLLAVQLLSQAVVWTAVGAAAGAAGRGPGLLAGLATVALLALCCGLAVARRRVQAGARSGECATTA